MSGNSKDQNKPAYFKKGDSILGKGFRDNLNKLSKSFPTNAGELPIRLYVLKEGGSWTETTDSTPAGMVYETETANRVELNLSSNDYDEEMLLSPSGVEPTIYHVLDTDPPDSMFYAIYNKQSGRWETLAVGPSGSGKCDTIIFEIVLPDFTGFDPIPESEWDVQCWAVYYANVIAMESTSDVVCQPCSINGQNYDETVSVTDIMGHLFNESISNIIDIGNVQRARRGEAKWMYIKSTMKCKWVVTEFDAAPYCE